MFDEEFDYEPIARCEECGELIYDNSEEIYMDANGNYFCSLECCHNFYGIHVAEDCLIGD